MYRFVGGVFLICLLAVLLGGCAEQPPAPAEIAVTTGSDEARAAFMEGREMFDRVRFAEAREHFTKAVEADPDFAFGHYYCALTAVNQMVFQEHLAKAVSLSSNVSDGERLLIEAMQAAADNNPAKQIEILQQLVEKFPGDKRSHFNLGVAYYFQDQDDRAISELKKVIEIDKDFSGAYNILGYVYREKEQYALAEEAFQNYINLLPEEANPYDSMADLYTRMGEHEKAIANYRKAAELNPKFSMSQRKIGTNLVFMGKYDEARQAFEKALGMEQTPGGRATDMLMISASFLYEGQPEKALEYADQAYQIAAEAGNVTQSAFIHATKCRIYIENGQFEDAQKSMAECMKIVEESQLSATVKENYAKNALFDEAHMLAKMKQFDEATAKAGEYKAKIEKGADPREMENYYALAGYIHLEKGEYAEAVENLKQADQENPYALYHLALAESESGNNAEAAALFKKVANWNQHGLLYPFVRAKAMGAPGN
jgi:tetratricopeptide (TPR) repeat protein